MLSKRIFVLVSLLLVSFLLVGCGTTPPIVDNQAPFITTDPVLTAQIGVEYTYDVDATDLDGDALTYSLIRNPSGMEIDEDTGLITWTPNSAGNFGVTVEVSDGVLSDTQPFTVTITPVTELTEIVVTPDTMDLEVGGIGTFTVTAYYNFRDPQDVTLFTDCVYTLPTPTTGVITVTAGSVTADGAGTDTIFISYTENDVTATANILVTVSGVRIPMEIIVDLPTFTVGGPYWFTVAMIANDDSGKSVKASFDWPISVLGVKIVGTLETDVYSDVTFTLVGDTFRTDPFLMEGITTVNFRGTFYEAGSYGTTITVETSPGDDLLCSLPITIVVETVVGDSYGGGIVAYIFVDGDLGYDENVQHGLIAAEADATLTMAWSNITNTSVGITGTAIGTGKANTTTIVEQGGCLSGAAFYCDTLDEGGYSDWFLPSKDELDKLYDNRDAINLFGDVYWSSSEYEFDTSLVWHQIFTNNGSQNYYNKSSAYCVCPVRYF